MADPKHLEILKRGIEAWNEWRENNPDIIPGLIDADLSGADLSRAKLSRAKLIDADLRGANLMGAVLSGANLWRANLSGANLNGADLNGANFMGAVLSGANLSEADLSGASFMGANLNDANLNSAEAYFTNFNNTDLNNANFEKSEFVYTTVTNCDLSNALKLASVIHAGPSSIGIDTILKSKAKIPTSFLRGCGIPDDVIKAVLKFAKERAFGFYSCFISYSHKDEIYAKKLKEDLEANNLSCWFFPEDAVWGKDIEENIDRGIRDYDKLIVICSENSLNSEPVLREIDRALQKEQSLKERHKKTKRILFPVIVDDYFYKTWDHYLKPLMLRIVYGDFRDWKDPTKYKIALNRLLEGLKKD